MPKTSDVTGNPVAVVSDDDDEVGRSGLGSKRAITKRKRSRRQSFPEVETGSEGASAMPESAQTNPGIPLNQTDKGNETKADADDIDDASKPKHSSKKSSPRRGLKTRSYLDEILAEKEAKKARKKSKAKGG